MERYSPREVTMTIEKSKNNGLTLKLKTPLFGLQYNIYIERHLDTELL